MPSISLPVKGSRPANQHPKTRKLSRSLKRKRDEDEVASLEKAAQEFDPKDANTFADLPLTRQTASGLDRAHFKTLTDIQRKALPLALKGLDVLGAAKTGSGKTLAFVVPVLEILYRQKWTSMDGLGALIVSPTRELATQIFEVLRKVGREHAFSAGLVIGGRKVEEERKAMYRMNIVVCTPGRMLQHMDQTTGLNLDNLQMLVIDEADRILDMGFKNVVDAIVQNLPKDRQTLLFSATQTKNVSDLARLSLKDPEYVAVHEAAEHATPKTLEQYYMVVPLPEKLDVLYSFVQNHKTSKILVFLSSCKQVRFVYETFRHLRPGMPLLHLHGKQKQTARADITARFSAAHESCLFSTDIAARGLDFPAVDWVVQVDAPEDADTYIHRVGRTARFEKTGRALLFLCPSEETGITSRLKAKKVPIVRVNAKAAKQKSIKDQLQNLCFKDPELKYLGQKAFVSYARSISVQKDRESFKLDALPLEEYASALGLPGAPRIKGFKKLDATKMKDLKNQPRRLKALENESSDNDDETPDSEKKDKPTKKQKEPRTRWERQMERQNQGVLAAHYTGLIEDSGSDAIADDEDFLKVKGRINPDDPDDTDTVAAAEDNTKKILVAPGKELRIDSKRREKLVTSKKELARIKGGGMKLVFDDDGTAHPLYELVDEAGFHEQGDAEEQRRRFLAEEQKAVAEADVEDRATAKEKRRLKKEKRRAREREIEAIEAGEDTKISLLPYEPAPDLEREESAAGDEGGAEGDRQVTKEKIRPKKWFEDESEDGEAVRKKKRKTKVVQVDEEPETLEELEALAAGLLA